MLKKVLFQAHWIVGITLGLVLAFQGLSGALLAFERELTAAFTGAVKVAPAGKPLAVDVLYGKVQAAIAGSSINSLTVYAAPERAAELRLAGQRGGPGGPGAPGGRGPGGGAPGGGGPGGGPGGGRNAVTYVNPYTGELLPAPGAAAQEFFSTIENLHRGMWAGRGTAGRFVRGLMSCSALALLLLMIGSGLYLRWPRGRSARNWRSWLKINWRLKGAAFLFNLHAVLGTCVLLIYVLSAHTGLMIGRQIGWYTRATAAAFNLTLPPERGEGGPGGGGPRPPGAPEGFGDRMGGEAQPGINMGAVWRAFSALVPSYEMATLTLPQDGGGMTVAVRYVPKGAPSEAAQTLGFDGRNGEAAEAPEAATRAPGEENGLAAAPVGGDSGFWKQMAGGRKPIHTGEYFGWPGQLVMMLSSLCMPVLFISGWMMYLARRRRKRAAAMRAANAPA